MLLNAGELIATRYEIIEKLGVGGMAMVYMAKDLKLDRYVTFKVLKEEHLSDEFVFSKFNTEARAAASLSNQNIVNVYDVGVEKDIHYIVMEYIDGITLKELIKMRAPFENEEALGVAIQIAQALSHAHANKVVHQDIKPQNILITTEGVVKVTDFGIASAQVSSSTTTATTPAGSVHYFSPEQARGRFVDHRSDIYSLGIVMYEMVTGKLPFEGESSVSIALKHINEPLPNISVPNVSSNVKKIINKATSKISNQRYSTVNEMIEDLKLSLTNEKSDFISTEDIIDSPTISLSEEEQSLITESIQVSNEELNESGNDSIDEYIQETLATDIDKNSQQRKLSKKFEILNESNDQKNKKESEKNVKALEKKIIYMGIGAASLISLILIAIAIIELFPNNTNEETAHTIVPNLLNLTVLEAEDMFNEYDINLEINYDYNDDVAYGLIFYQYPTQGTIEGDISNISITVSLGLASFEVPNLIGNTLSNAEGIFATQYGINLHTVGMRSDEYVIGIVMNQSPAAGTMLTIGEDVTVTVSTGPEEIQVSVPIVNGISESNAVALLTANELTFSISRVINDDVPEGYVIVQSISPGTDVAPGTQIVLTVSTGPMEVVVPEPTPDEEPVEEEPYEQNEIPQVPAPITNTISFSFPSHLYDDEIYNQEVHVAAVVAGSTVFDEIVNVNSFPIPITITSDGPGSKIVQFFVGGQLISEDVVVFN